MRESDLSPGSGEEYEAPERIGDVRVADRAWGMGDFEDSPGEAGYLREFSWTEDNRLREVRSSGESVSFLYDAVGLAHSHAAYDPGYDNNNFSEADKKLAAKGDVPSYVSTPDGSLKKYDPSTSVTSIINEDMPSDPNDPARKNTISPHTNPTDDPSRNWIDRIGVFFHNLF